ncbi:ERI1 exoribonuclease 2 isoform X1 [Cyprinodon tularosa]|uniref:ERI1 exoribonuclease 2 isoform X1 n=1 Tax=Cyprinodon tularosa TaxID=77115 RepID=UPI0018E1F8E9|nr:ERI1 exoribonuclease 2 isoform X1 [Cyprinodon tularosa]
MSTRKLAKKLGLLRQRSQSAPGLKKSGISNQIFSYLIVIDFESTCWREKNNHGQEIIEFPAVLLNTSTGEVESEFHTYVQPQEHPVLSEFCTELTGITQGQVESGVPLQICLSRFNRWLQNLRMEKGVMFPNNKQTSSASSPSQKLCTFLTWSDWDLGVCLQYECKRKQLHKPDVLNSWIDLRSTYRLFYSRKPKGLNGALQDLGIQFSGREHSGLDDARNTARLAARMMRDGCVLKITRSLERTPLSVKSLFSRNFSATENKQEKEKKEREKEKNVSNKENLSTTSRWPSSSNLPAKAHQKCPSPEEPPNSSTGQTCQILIPTKTLLKVTPAPQQGQSGKSVTAQAAHGLLSTSVINLNPPHSNGSISSHVLCSTTIGCISDLPHNTTTAQVDEEDGELIVETDERCGSYDDVLLPFDDSEMDTISVDVGCISDFDSRCQDLEGMDRSSVGPLSLQPENLKMPNVSRDLSMMCKSLNMLNSNVKKFKGTHEKLHPMTTKEPDKCFALPTVVDWSKLNQCRSGPLEKDRCDKDGQTKGVCPVPPKPFLPEKTSTPNPSTMRPKPNERKHRESLKSSFTIYTDPNKTAESLHPSTSSSLHPSRNILSSLHTNVISCSKQVHIASTAKGPKLTAPLCACGRRARRQVVSNGGPNHGRGFYCCPVRRSAGRGSTGKGCGFFKWESALIKSSMVAPPAVQSSISLCEVNSTLQYRPPQRRSY